MTEGVAEAHPDADHTVHVDADGLEAGTTYFYGFEALGDHSPVARTRTLPGPGADHPRVAMVSCPKYTAGPLQPRFPLGSSREARVPRDRAGAGAE